MSIEDLQCLELNKVNGTYHIAPSFSTEQFCFTYNKRNAELIIKAFKENARFKRALRDIIKVDSGWTCVRDCGSCEEKDRIANEALKGQTT